MKDSLWPKGIFSQGNGSEGFPFTDFQDDYILFMSIKTVNLQFTEDFM